MLCHNCMGYGWTMRVWFAEDGTPQTEDMPCLACDRSGHIEDGHEDEAPVGVRPVAGFA